MAGEPESLHRHEALGRRIERHDYDRLLMLSDGVFAIAITLLALEMKLPERWDGSLDALLSEASRPLIGYLFGFGLVGVFWFIHRRVFAKLEQVDAGITVLNLLLLGLVGLTPYVARMIAEAGPARAMPFYFLAVGGVLGLFAAIEAWAAWRPRLLHDGVNKVSWRIDLTYYALTAAALAGLGGWAIIEHRPVGSQSVVVVFALLAVARRLSRRFAPQISSTSRP